MAMEKQDTVAVGQGPTPMKFSRYRSVRKAASKKPQEISPSARPPLPSPPSAAAQLPHDGAMGSNGTVKRSMSRYRRQRAPTANSSPDATHQPPVPDRALAYRAAQAHADAKAGAVAHRAPGKSAADSRQPAKLDTSGKNYYPSRDKTGRNFGDDDEDEVAREKHRQNAMDCLTGGGKTSPTSALPFRRPPTRDRDADRKNRADGETSQHRRRSSYEPRRQSMKEAKSQRQPNHDVSQSAVEPTPVNRFPGLDAPVSAVNAGERKVNVRYRKTTLELCVTPSTSAQDLLFTASDCLSGEIDPLKFILMESFTELGLERPLRRYEYVREVMNSWAHDQQNTLIIVPAASLKALSQLDAQCVPAEQPADVTLHMYYSQRPRKWDKRFITLRSDGQVTFSKKEQGQEQVNICHLSDFDMYSPTPGYLSNNVKPPKKICQAIKSQQKSTMFLSTENFVHFFCTNDKIVADAWHKAVHAWRSWYLVNKMGAGVEDRGPAEADEPAGPKRPFKPLLNMDSEYSSGEGSVPPPLDRKKSSKSKELFSRKKNTREHAPPPSSFPKMFTDESDSPAASSTDDSPFQSSGLLGRTYTMRQKAMKDREDMEKKATEDPFLAQGLVGTMDSRRRGSGSRPNSRSNTMTSTQAPDLSGLKRQLSVNKNKPLVDLTPVYQEPPQHSRPKGRGVAVEPGVPLIDGATGPEAPGGIVIPSATTWRRVPAELPSPTAETRTRKRSNTARSTSNQRHHHGAAAPATPISPAEGAQREEPFIPNSLLSRSAQLATVQGAPIGHGVATGDRTATKPMLDMSPANPFTEGSLLRGL